MSFSPHTPETAIAGERHPGKWALPATLAPESITAIVDSREQLPLNLEPLQTVRGTLTTGDYSVRGLEHCIAIERKSLPDLLGCCCRDRDRFDREIQRLLAYPVRCLVVESSWPEIEAGGWRSDLTTSHVIGSLLGWIGLGVPVVLAGDHARAGKVVSRLLFIATRRKYRELRALTGGIGRSAATNTEVDEVTAL